MTDIEGCEAYVHVDRLDSLQSNLGTPHWATQSLVWEVITSQVDSQFGQK